MTPAAILVRAVLLGSAGIAFAVALTYGSGDPERLQWSRLVWVVPLAWLIMVAGTLVTQWALDRTGRADAITARSIHLRLGFMLMALVVIVGGQLLVLGA